MGVDFGWPESMADGFFQLGAKCCSKGAVHCPSELRHRAPWERQAASANEDVGAENRVGAGLVVRELPHCGCGIWPVLE